MAPFFRCAASCCFQPHSAPFCWVLQEGQSVTLEPGGQFELSGATLESLHQTCAEVNSHLYQVSARLPLGGAVAAASPCPPPVRLQSSRGDLPLSCCPCPALPALPTCCRCGRYVRSWALPSWGLALTPSGATRTCPACPRPGGCGWDSADRGGSFGQWLLLVGRRGMAHLPVLSHASHPAAMHLVRWVPAFEHLGPACPRLTAARVARAACPPGSPLQVRHHA